MAQSVSILDVNDLCLSFLILKDLLSETCADQYSKASALIAI